MLSIKICLSVSHFRAVSHYGVYADTYSAGKVLTFSGLQAYGT